MTEQKNNYTVRELFEIARRGMIWVGKSIENKIDKHESANMWVKEEDITLGIIAVKSSIIHARYVKWCKERGITGKNVLNLVEFGRYLRQNFKYTAQYGSIHYYINKELAENDEEKKKRQERYLKRKQKTKKETPQE